MKKQEELLEELKEIDRKLSEIDRKDYLYNPEKRKEIEKLHRSYYRIENSLEVMDYTLVSTSSKIDLYKENAESITGKYQICLHDTFTKIGYIDYRQDTPYIGDIGYAIETEYRGNNYSYYALCEVLKILSSTGINKITIKVHPENQASLRILEKLEEIQIPYTITKTKEYSIKYELKK